MSKPAHYRKNICGKILEAIAKGESVSIIGVGSSGKSNVARHLMRADARAASLGAAADSLFAVLVDCMKYVEPTAVALYRLILQSLAQSTQLPDAPAAVAKLHAPFNQLLEKAFDTDQFDRVRYYLEQAIEAVFKSSISQMFFVLDDFDHALVKAPAQALNSLRGLRDNHKNKLMFLVVTRKELAFLREEIEYEDFAEIVTPITIPVGMYDYPDALLAADELIGRWNLQARVDNAAKRNVIEWSGAHPGLMKAILNIGNRNPGFDFGSRDSLQRLFGHKDMLPECDKIWASLEDDERQALISAFTGGTPDARLIGRLRNKELVRERGSGVYAAFSPVFEDYVRGLASQGAEAQSSDSASAVVQLDAASSSIRIDGRKVTDIDETEYRLFERLYSRRNTPVTKRALLEVMLSSGSVATARFSGMPEQRLERYMGALMGKVNSGGRAYIIAEPDAYRFKD
jgi:hypothetical protein